MSNLKGFDELAKKLKSIEGKVANKVVRKGVSKMAQIVRKEMRHKAPRKRTGKLHKNLRYRIKRSSRGGFTATVGAFGSAYYANFIEKGTKPHRIPNKKRGRGRLKRDNNAKLAFGGQVVSSVEHPGISPQPFIEKAFNASKSQAIKEAGRIMFKELQKL